MRVGVFCIESGEAVATDNLMEIKLVSDKESTSPSDTLLLKSHSISNVKKGLWIAGTKYHLWWSYRKSSDFFNYSFTLSFAFRNRVLFYTIRGDFQICILCTALFATSRLVKVKNVTLNLFSMSVLFKDLWFSRIVGPVLWPRKELSIWCRCLR